VQSCAGDESGEVWLGSGNNGKTDIILLCVWQILNIQNVLQLYKENLEALNAEFGMHRHPPSMYLSVRSSRLDFSFFLFPVGFMLSYSVRRQ